MLHVQFPTPVPSNLFDTHMLLSLLYSHTVLSIYDSAITDLKAASMQILVTSGECGGHYHQEKPPTLARCSDFLLLSFSLSIT
jgi:hypothetical protein